MDEEVRAAWAAGDAVLCTNDADAIAALFTDDWVYLDGGGFTTRAELLDAIRSGLLVHHSMETAGPVRVSLQGDVAILSARKASTGAWDGESYAVEEWITDVMRRSAEGWACAFTQKTPI